MGGLDDRALDRVRFWVIVLTVLALTVPAVVSYRRLWRNFPMPEPFRSQGELSLVLDQFASNRMVSISTGLAAREIAGGKVESIAAPEELRTLADRESDVFQGQERPALNSLYIRQSSGALLVASDHDVVLSDEELDELRAVAMFVEHPREVFAVIGGADERDVVLYTDDERHNVYVVPASLSPDGPR